MVWKAGFGKADITAYEPLMPMLGWECPDSRIRGVLMPLHARALVLEASDGHRFAYACAELCVMSIAVREAVVERLGAAAPGAWGPHNVMLTATHTHSGPSGYSHYAVLHANARGFSPVVFDAIVDGIVAVILEAHLACVPATLRVGTVAIPWEVPVAFNRSVRAYNANAEVEPVAAGRSERATNRESVTLRVDTAHGGRPLGMINWFGVHGTSLRPHNTHLHPDNKGIAARCVERSMAANGAPRFIAIFAQTAAGDVVPTASRGSGRADVAHDLAHAEEHGALQADHALRALDVALRRPPLACALSFSARHVDLSRAVVAPELAEGDDEATTTSGIFGIRSVAGTADGPGPLSDWVFVIDAATSLARWAQRIAGLRVEPKLPFVDVEDGVRGRFLGALSTQKWMPLVARRERAIAYLDAAHRAGALDDRPWAPRVVPLQVACIGSLLVCAIPGEPTTQAGAALARTAAHAATESGHPPATVVVNGYANGYAGYLTTRAEYALQSYEGSSTLYGEWTLAIHQMAIDAMLRAPGATKVDEAVPGPPIALPSRQVLLRERLAGRAHGASQR